ncbi:hypothetical protein [Clostridium paraputrificum]|uniref:hypothetical protein n=1 Tax=Clostridium paraputrificum TaxID=29363 RepID=UPI000407084E|nr:hypothetical protein [Clostridium paraputrificum]MDB2122844.1 hypothetical protein [Clostridium paraputrificum]
MKCFDIEVVEIDKESKLIDKALELGVKYGQADKPTKIEVGKLMTGNRRIKRNRGKKKKCL